MSSKLVERRLNDFKRRCGKDGDAALQLAYHAAMPVALNPELLHFLRINFFLDPPEQLPYTVEFEFLSSGLCREIDAELYEIEPEIRSKLLHELRSRKDAPQRIRDIATLLWQYVEYHSPWADRVELERAQQLTALNFLDPAKAKEWLHKAGANPSIGRGEREWFIAMRQEIKELSDLPDDTLDLNHKQGGIKILFLAADPSDASRLRLGQELRNIKERLRIAKAPEKYQLEQRESVRVGDITQAVLDVEPNIIHFSGHGTSQGELCFENDVGIVQSVQPDDFAAMFKLFAQHVNCVVLNACYSEIQAKAIAQHIPFVIGMNNAIGDKAAIAFAVGFYKALAANRSIEDAYKFGCVEIRLQGIAEHLKPVIYVKKHLIPASKPRAERAIPNPFIPPNGRVEDSQLFFGRQREMQRVFEVLNSGSSVALIGEEGIGKSSLLWAICQQAKNRLQPPRQSVFLDLNYIDNEDDFYSALCHEVGIAECTGYMLTRNLKAHKNKVLLSLDNVGKMTWQGFTRGVRDKLRGLAEGSNAPLKLILAATEPLNDLFNDSHDDGKTSPLEGICQEEHIQPWNETTMRAFIANRLAGTSVSFTEEEIMQLVQESSGHPRKLMQLCYRIYARYTGGVQ